MVRRWSHYSIREHEALFELDRQLGLGSVPRNRWIFPARLHITQHQPDELGGSLFTGEVAAHPHRLADLSVKALDGIGGVEDFAQVRREGEERYHLLPVAPPALGNRWIFLPPGAAVKILQPRARRRGRLGLVDRFERCRHRPPFLPRGKVHRVTDEMHDAGLDHGLGRGCRKFRVCEPYREARKGRRKVWRRTGKKESRMKCWTNFWRDEIRRRCSKPEVWLTS